MDVERNEMIFMSVIWKSIIPFQTCYKWRHYFVLYLNLFSKDIDLLMLLKLWTLW